MRYPSHILDEIRARMPVSAVVGRRVRLKKAGREWKGLSPFNAEKTPSFYVNDQKGFYHCFSSGRHGDIFRFLMDTEGMPFPEAVERLAAEAGVELPKVSDETEVEVRRRRTLHEALELAASWFEAQLAGPAGRAARDTLTRRAIAPELRATFRIGYAPPDRFALRDHLASRDVPADLMVEAGLLVGGDEVAVPYDRFRDRLIFPIADGRGRVVGFGGRAMAADARAKYLNSPETTLFDKGRLLYNLHAARPAAQARGTVVAVEGYVDVVALHGAGFPHTVAPLGTAITAEQLALLWRMADEPILCLDGDAAGRRAAYRALDVALPILPAGKSLRFALLPDGQDPDDLARAGGTAAIERVLGAARPLADMLWARELEVSPADTPERRAGLARRLREAVATITDETLRRFYKADMEARLDGLAPRGTGRFERRAGRPGGLGFARRFEGRPGGASAGAVLQASPLLAGSALFAGTTASSREALIVAALFVHPDALAGHAEALAEAEFADRDCRALAAILLDCAAEGEAPGRAALAACLDRSGLAPALDRARARVGVGDRWMLDPEPVRAVGDAIHQALLLQRKARTLHTELRAAEQALATDGSDETLGWLREVQSELQSTQGEDAGVGG